MRYFKSGHKPRPRHAPGTMNKTEAQYAAQLEILKRNDLIYDYSFETLKFKLADRTYYTPDFIVISDCIEIHEVKASTSKGRTLIEDDAAVKIKVAAEQFPYFTFYLVSIGKTGIKMQLIESTRDTSEKVLNIA